MKVTRHQLRRIIKEEKRKILREGRSASEPDVVAAVKAMIDEMGEDFAADFVAGMAEEIASGAYSGDSGGGSTNVAQAMEDQIEAAANKVGFDHTGIINDSGDIYIDSELSPYDDTWSALADELVSINGVTEVLEGDDGMVVEIDWDAV